MREVEIEKGRDKGKQKVRFDDGEVSAHLLEFGGIAWRADGSRMGRHTSPIGAACSE